MAIEVEDLRTILRGLKANGVKPGGELLVLGNANVCFGAMDLRRIAKEEHFLLSEEPKTESITLTQLGRTLGFDKTSVLDFETGKGEYSFDLTGAIPAEVNSKMAAIIDAGCLFWCFDVAAGLKNIYSMLRKDGVVFHITAVSGFISRGYYNIHPRLFENFYDANQAKFLITSYRPNFARSGLLSKLKKFLCLQNRTTFYTEAGHIFPQSVTPNRIRFGRQVVVNLPFIPIDIVGVAGFQKKSLEAPKTPLLRAL